MGIRVFGRSPEPEIWYYNMARSVLSRLRPTYPEYVDAALRTKGATGWQYLFADPKVGRRMLRQLNLAEGWRSVSISSRRSRGQDYSDLRARLEDRT